MYGFTTHYTLFVIILSMMALTGGFSKLGVDEVVVIFAGIPVTDCPCSTPVKVWFGSYIFLCPLYLLISIIA